MSFIRRNISSKRLKIEDFIKQYKKFLVKEEIFKTKDDVEYFFLMGGCYIFARILKKEYPDAEFLIDYDKKHCKIGFRNKTFDILGPKKKLLDKKFHFATAEDIKYMENSFGFENYVIEGKELSKELFDERFISETLALFHNTSKVNNLGTFTITNRKW